MFFNASIDSEVDSAIEQQNKNVRRYMQMLEQAREQKSELEQEIIHLKAMYESSKANGEMLEQQIDVVSQHWLKKYIEVSDELFDIKNTKK
jgi:DNA-binding transcriptional regulator GbsR (MarR family)